VDLRPARTIRRECLPSWPRPAIGGSPVVQHTRAFGSQSAYSSRHASGDRRRGQFCWTATCRNPPELIPQLRRPPGVRGTRSSTAERVAREGPCGYERRPEGRFYRIFQRPLPYRLDAHRLPATSRCSTRRGGGRHQRVYPRLTGSYAGLPRVRGLSPDWRSVRASPSACFGRSSNNFLANVGLGQGGAIISFSYVPLDLIGLACVGHNCPFAPRGGRFVEIALKIADPSAAPQGVCHADRRGAVSWGGVQLICFSVIGSYLAHMYEEVKGREPPLHSRSCAQPAAAAGFVDARDRQRLEARRRNAWLPTKIEPAISQMEHLNMQREIPERAANVGRIALESAFGRRPGRFSSLGALGRPGWRSLTTTARAQLRSQILELVRDYHDVAFAPTEFRPGETQIHFAGRVFDEGASLVHLVDSSLDFLADHRSLRRALRA